MLRQTLGDFSSIVCFKAAITGMEDALGDKATAIALTTSGRSRGKQLAQELNLSIATMSWEDITSKISYALGKDGTRLCIVENIFLEGEKIIVQTSETLCSAGEPQGSERKCTYTLGAIWGAMEQVTGKRLLGKHTESVLRGGNYDVFEFAELK
ncbi:hydrocarbon-binding protein [Calothrix sp. 336/3]|uniref:hydrocarbon-binding protein n=1 Tax=Calothrix sp. 336/3 TaxID=1337936 RepID=UPI0004E32BFE|nr:hydrocarbon-binding protein [Calothrix sp. 336/3]AKG22565.1 hydrocarbon-binding protein [Calothrix sp. 336/3]